MVPRPSPFSLEICRVLWVVIIIHGGLVLLWSFVWMMASGAKQVLRTTYRYLLRQASDLEKRQGVLKYRAQVAGGHERWGTYRWVAGGTGLWE